MSIQRHREEGLYGLVSDDNGPWVLYADHVAAVAEAVKKAMDSARARLLMVPSTRCHPKNPNIEMVEQEEAYCAVLDVLPIGIPGYSHPKDAMKAAREAERARIRAAMQAYLLDRWGPTDSNRPTDEWCRELTSELVAIIDGEQA